MSEKMSSMIAVTLRYILIGIIALFVAGIGFVFLTARDILMAKAIETDHARIDSEIAQEDITRLKQLKTTLEQDKDVIAKTSDIVADSQSYKFQDQVIKDITSYASAANVGIIGFDFGQKPGEAPTAGKSSTSSLRRTLVSIQLANDIPYTSLLTFIKSIEQNITKMQLTGINFQPKKDNPTLITGSTIQIEVYLR